jgi:hypothetical protein
MSLLFRIPLTAVPLAASIGCTRGITVTSKYLSDPLFYCNAETFTFARTFQATRETDRTRSHRWTTLRYARTPC